MISFLYLKRPTFYTRDFKEIEISRKISNNHNPPTYVQGLCISNSFFKSIGFSFGHQLELKFRNEGGNKKSLKRYHVSRKPVEGKGVGTKLTI